MNRYPPPIIPVKLSRTCSGSAEYSTEWIIVSRSKFPEISDSCLVCSLSKRGIRARLSITLFPIPRPFNDHFGNRAFMDLRVTHVHTRCPAQQKTNFTKRYQGKRNGKTIDNFGILGVFKVQKKILVPIIWFSLHLMPLLSLLRAVRWPFIYELF